MSTTTENILEVVPNIFSTILELDVSPLAEALPSEAGIRYVTATVQISGTWEGMATLTFPGALATKCAGLMFEVAPDEATDEDIEDAMGELANMTGGSFKSLLEGSCELGLPVVTIGAEYSVRFPGSRVDCEVFFQCEGFCFKAVVHVREDIDLDV
ncbi:MAG: chemotaxis protein CheX [Myxococcota bacterium]|nr:chemotaxis protein CheX [Myxococcota bacterium]